VLAPISRERTGYPSQKPEVLVQRLVMALTSPGERVLDPYAGSGTTLAAARALGRVYIGIDSSDVAIRTISERLGPFEPFDASDDGDLERRLPRPVAAAIAGRR